MASNYTQFSFWMALPDKSAIDYALRLAEEFENAEGVIEPEGFPGTRHMFESIEEFGPGGCTITADSDGIAIYTDDGRLELVELFVQHLLRKYKMADTVRIQAAFTCSRPVTDEFGGYVALISADKIDYMHTSSWTPDVFDEEERNVVYELALRMLKSAGIKKVLTEMDVAEDERKSIHNKLQKLMNPDSFKA